MGKAKLTLYMDEKIIHLAKKIAKLSEKSISALVQSFFIKQAKSIENREIDTDIAHWIGIIDTDKEYKELRDNYIKENIEKYENIY
jgi:uncharacterized protein YdaU (DUF1376 family)